MSAALLQPDPPQPESAPQSLLPEGLAVFIGYLCDALAGECGANRYFAPIGVFLWARLQRTVERFELLFNRWREGRLPAARRPRSNPQDSRPTAPTKPISTLPGGFAWLVKLMPHAACYRVFLQDVLLNPELPAFLAAAPQAGRMLRPLCRMLGMQPFPHSLRSPPPNPNAPPRKRRTVTKIPSKMRFWVDRNGATGPRNALPKDLRWVRPVSWWDGPLFPRRKRYDADIDDHPPPKEPPS